MYLVLKLAIRKFWGRAECYHPVTKINKGRTVKPMKWKISMICLSSVFVSPIDAYLLYRMMTLSQGSNYKAKCRLHHYVGYWYIILVAFLDLCKIQQPQLAISNFLMCIEIKNFRQQFVFSMLDSQCRCYMYLLLSIKFAWTDKIHNQCILPLLILFHIWHV